MDIRYIFMCSRDARLSTMEEQVSAVERFGDDLCALGVGQPHLVIAISLYVDALSRPSQETWGALYRHVLRTLQEWPGEPVRLDAAQRVLALIDDDFGRNVLDTPVRARLRETLLRHRVAS